MEKESESSILLDNGFGNEGSGFAVSLSWVETIHRVVQLDDLGSASLAIMLHRCRTPAPGSVRGLVPSLCSAIGKW